MYDGLATHAEIHKLTHTNAVIDSLYIYLCTLGTSYSSWHRITLISFNGRKLLVLRFSKFNGNIATAGMDVGGEMSDDKKKTRCRQIKKDRKEERKKGRWKREKEKKKDREGVKIGGRAKHAKKMQKKDKFSIRQKKKIWAKANSSESLPLDTIYSEWNPFNMHSEKFISYRMI